MRFSTWVQHHTILLPFSLSVSSTVFGLYCILSTLYLGGCIEGMDRVIGPFPSNPSGPFWDLGPSVLFGEFPSLDNIHVIRAYKVQLYNRITTFFFVLMHHAQYQGTMFAGAETRSTGARRSPLRGWGAHPATACASPSPSYSSSSSSDWWIEHYTLRLATFERLVTYYTSAALDKADDATMVRTHKRLAEASAEVAKHRLLILHETARRIRPHSLVDTSGAVARGLPL